jgi:cytochrome b561
MNLLNTKNSFGLIAKSFHWVLAILILWMLSVGFAMVSIPPSPDKFWVYALHKSFGIFILTLMLGRLAWRIISPRPDALPTHKEWEDRLAKFVHFALYICIFMMPLSGWLMSSAGGFPAMFFGLFALPPVLPKNETAFAITRTIHAFAAYGILTLLALHVAGALKHHFIDKDATLQRMTTRKLGLWGGLILAAVAGLLWIAPIMLAIFGSNKAEAVQSVQTAPDPQAQAPAAPARDDAWQIDLDTSLIKFETTQYGEPFQGEFKNFGGTIIFNRDHLDDAYADIWIDIASIVTGSAERDEQARNAEWFDAANFPKALYVADSFSETASGHYIAHGALTIRGEARLVDLPFTLQIRESPEGQAALMEATLTLKRLDFGVGQGQWSATDTIGGDVKIMITLLATQE